MHMHTELIIYKNHTIAKLTTDELLISNTQEAVDILMNCAYQGADCMIIEKHHLHPDFFNLKTKIAGDILQKFSTYQMRLIIIGDFEQYSSQSLKDFIYESNKGGRFIFKPTVEQALHILSNSI